MSCYHPIYAFNSGLLTDKGGRKLIMTNYHVDEYPVSKLDPDAFKHFGDHIRYDSDGHGFLIDRYELPCGKCIGCSLDRSRSWAMRCIKEASLYPDGYNWFVTLTYDDDHLKSPFLVKKDFQDFMKRLRRKMEYDGFQSSGIRFFGCGEYGSKNGRPHFHVILFNCPLPDCVPLRPGDVDHCMYYSSDLISSVWKNGFSYVGEVTFDSCAYVARYVLKKVQDDESVIHSDDFVPEFIIMSRKPGIAYDWFMLNKDKIYQTDEILLTDRKNRLIKLKPCRYFDNYYDVDHHEELLEIKANRQLVASISNATKLHSLHMKHIDYVRSYEEKLKKQDISRLKRRLDK